MSARALAEIVAAHDDALRWIGVALDPGGPLPDLSALRAQLRRRLDQLRAALSPPLTQELAIEVLVPLVFFLDERVQRDLVRRAKNADGGAPRWPLLQRDLFPEGYGDGGDAFFERAAELTRQEEPDPIVVQSYLVCLAAGFTGRHFDDPAALQTVRARLVELLAKPANAAPRPVPESRPLVARPAWSYWLIGLLVIALAQGFLALVALHG